MCQQNIRDVVFSYRLYVNFWHHLVSTELDILIFYNFISIKYGYEAL